jgi:CBS domain containing-hemolysin-like protein
LVKLKKSRIKIRHWIIAIILWSFFLAIAVSFISETLIIKTNLIVTLVTLIIIISIGVLFDIIGVAITACPEAPLHSAATGKKKGAREAVRLLQHADKVSNFCNDVIGDICGILSGAIGAILVFRILIINPNLESALLSAVITGFISSLTIGGKAIGKNVAIKNSIPIVLKTGYAVYLLSFFSRIRNGNRKKS